jgi:hypothetical protein
MHTTIALQKESEAERISRFGDWYDNYCNFESEPTTITVHEVWDQYGGPEEGGWTYRCGEPVETICIFSKAQAVRELHRLHTKYEDGWGDILYDICLAQKYAEAYPKSKPFYE